MKKQKQLKQLFKNNTIDAQEFIKTDLGNLIDAQVAGSDMFDEIFDKLETKISTTASAYLKSIELLYRIKFVKSDKELLKHYLVLEIAKAFVEKKKCWYEFNGEKFNLKKNNK